MSVIDDIPLRFDNSHADNTQRDTKYAVILSSKEMRILVIKYTRMSQLIRHLFKVNSKYTIHRIFKNIPSNDHLKIT